MLAEAIADPAAMPRTGDALVLNVEGAIAEADGARLANACFLIGEGLNWAARTGFE